MRKTLKRIFYAAFLLFVAGYAVWGYTLTKTSSTADLETVTIGYQAGDPLSISKARGQLVKKMKAKGYRVVFKEFQNGAAEMEAMSSGTIDYARVGDTPPVTAAAGGTKLTIVAAGSSKKNGSGLVVKKASSIKTIKDLKGKKIAYTSNTSSQYMVLKVLKKAGLSTKDVKLMDMSQSSAAVAFAKGKVDVWANWDPSTAQAELQYKGYMLVSGSDVGVNNRDLLISGNYAGNHEDVTDLLVEYLADDMDWANTHKSKLITMMAKDLKLSKKVVSKQVNRRTFWFGKMTTAYTAEEQSIADLLYEQGIIKKQVTMADFVAK
ncbi:aliphatic sulfonate ABC transporter substrate-binding protein [Lacticaseibacillus sharpeae]|uniref:Putative aliphatic sulfonates-binding protein n=1 Tax=Lacticaseibacillus sharpeae JCM 1186 = DSM 20505 TaxID=1291052 RepID=A0A0R1ZLC2_9LACO|nr:aliphatic sulfonate ABC transporter substrate-binding protein [Lacticaseibacillus sharpeae]KRM55783.1 nitrate sulfonate bicarbonate ABC transporter substrate-binding protein [Lacticaseibacillus sharpeae JCM 1186 = DSM 20505]